MGGDASNETYARCAKTDRSLDRNEGRKSLRYEGGTCRKPPAHKAREGNRERAAKDDYGLCRKEDR